MRDQALFQKIAHHLLRVLHKVSAERGVSRAALRPGLRVVLDDHLERLGTVRRITARCRSFGLIAGMAASCLPVLATGCRYCERTHGSAAAGWLRECVRAAASALSPHGTDSMNGSRP